MKKKPAIITQTFYMNPINFKPVFVEIAQMALKRNSEFIIELKREKSDLKGVVYHNEANRSRSAYINNKLNDLHELNDALRAYIQKRMTAIDIKYNHIIETN